MKLKVPIYTIPIILLLVHTLRADIGHPYAYYSILPNVIISNAKEYPELSFAYCRRERSNQSSPSSLKKYKCHKISDKRDDKILQIFFISFSQPYTMFDKIFHTTTMDNEGDTYIMIYEKILNFNNQSMLLKNQVLFFPTIISEPNYLTYCTISSETYYLKVEPNRYYLPTKLALKLQKKVVGYTDRADKIYTIDDIQNSFRECDTITIY